LGCNKSYVRRQRQVSNVVNTSRNRDRVTRHGCSEGVLNGRQIVAPCFTTRLCGGVAKTNATLRDPDAVLGIGAGTTSRCSVTSRFPYRRFRARATSGGDAPHNLCGGVFAVSARI
jgi:hypothetical protein